MAEANCLGHCKDLSVQMLDSVIEKGFRTGSSFKHTFNYDDKNISVEMFYSTFGIIEKLINCHKSTHCWPLSGVFEKLLLCFGQDVVSSLSVDAMKTCFGLLQECVPTDGTKSIQKYLSDEQRVMKLINFCNFMNIYPKSRMAAHAWEVTLKELDTTSEIVKVSYPVNQEIQKWFEEKINAKSSSRIWTREKILAYNLMSSIHCYDEKEALNIIALLLMVNPRPENEDIIWSCVTYFIKQEDSIPYRFMFDMISRNYVMRASFIVSIVMRCMETLKSDIEEISQSVPELLKKSNENSDLIYKLLIGDKNWKFTLPYCSDVVFRDQVEDCFTPMGVNKGAAHMYDRAYQISFEAYIDPYFSRARKLFLENPVQFDSFVASKFESYFALDKTRKGNLKRKSSSKELKNGKRKSIENGKAEVEDDGLMDFSVYEDPCQDIFELDGNDQDVFTDRIQVRNRESKHPSCFWTDNQYQQLEGQVIMVKGPFDSSCVSLSNIVANRFKKLLNSKYIQPIGMVSYRIPIKDGYKWYLVSEDLYHIDQKELENPSNRTELKSLKTENLKINVVEMDKENLKLLDEEENLIARKSFILCLVFRYALRTRRTFLRHILWDKKQGICYSVSEDAILCSTANKTLLDDNLDYDSKVLIRKWLLSDWCHLLLINELPKWVKSIQESKNLLELLSYDSNRLKNCIQTAQNPELLKSLV
jgi:hypothetical protein